MFKNFETIGEIISAYEARGLLRGGAAREAMSKSPGAVATMQDRFAILALCAIDEERMLRMTGMFPMRHMDQDQKDAWAAICKAAVAAAKDTPEGRLFHKDLSDSPNAYTWLSGAMDNYRFAVARSAWRSRFTMEGGLMLLDGIMDAAASKGAFLTPSEAMAVYAKAAEDLPWKPSIFPYEGMESVEWALKELSLLPSGESPVTKERYLALPIQKRIACARACAVRLVSKISQEYDPASVYTEMCSLHPDDWYLHTAAAQDRSDGTWSVWTLNLSKDSLECGHYRLKDPVASMNGKRSRE